MKPLIWKKTKNLFMYKRYIYTLQHENSLIKPEQNQTKWNIRLLSSAI